MLCPRPVIAAVSGLLGRGGGLGWWSCGATCRGGGSRKDAIMGVFCRRGWGRAADRRGAGEDAAGLGRHSRAMDLILTDAGVDRRRSGCDGTGQSASYPRPKARHTG